ncbi:MAG: rhombosortase [Desulfobulbaceae bacterium]|nr:rhombosortase [Desulfobulbaceae bacterium]
MQKIKDISTVNTVPLYSISLGVLSFILFYTSAALQALQYDRLAVGRGEVWRILTGHLTHWNTEHLIWNVAVFCGLGILSELYDRKGYLLCLALSSLIIPLSLWWLEPSLSSYRGLSGVASGLFLFVAVRILMDNINNKQWLSVAAAVIFTTGFLGKIIYETITGATVFASTGGLYEPVPLVHFIGGLAGLVVALTGPVCKSFIKTTRP